MPVIITRTKPGRRRGPARSRRRTGRKGVMTSMWGSITSMFTVLFLTLDTTFMMVCLILSLIMMGLTAFAEFTGADLTGPGPAGKTGGKPKPRGSSRSRPRRSGGGPTKPRKRVCSARCRRSAPSSPCSCICGGKSWIDASGKAQGHGSEHP